MYIESFSYICTVTNQKTHFVMKQFDLIFDVRRPAPYFKYPLVGVFYREHGSSEDYKQLSCYEDGDPDDFDGASDEALVYWIACDLIGIYKSDPVNQYFSAYPFTKIFSLLSADETIQGLKTELTANSFVISFTIESNGQA